MFRQSDPLISSLKLLHKDLWKPQAKVKSCDLLFMHDDNIMLRCKFSSDWLEIHVTERGFR